MSFNVAQTFSSDTPGFEPNEKGRIVIEGDTGEITFRITGTGISDPNVKITPLTNNQQFRNFLSDINDQLSAVRDSVDTLPNEFVSGRLGRRDLPNQIKDTITGGGGGTVLLNQTISFPPVRVPSTDANPISHDNISAFPVEALVQETGTFDVRPDTYEFLMRIPPEAFIEIVDLSGRQFQCGSLFNTIDREIGSLTSEADRVEGRLSGDMQTLDEVAQRVIDVSEGLAGGGSPRFRPGGIGRAGGDETDQILQNLQDISPADIAGIGSSLESTLRERIDKTLPTDLDVSGLESDVSELQDRIENLPVNRCRDEFDISNLANRVDDLQSRFNLAQNKKDRLLELLTGVGRVDCADAFSGVASEVNQVVNEIEDLSTPVNRQTFQSGLESISSAITSVETEIPSDHTCSDQFISRLNRAETTLRELPKEDFEKPGLGCQDVSDSLKESVRSAERNVSEFIGEGIGNKSSLQRNIDNLRDRVENDVSDDNPCKSQLLDRLQEAETRLQGAELGCGDVPKRISNNVASFGSAAETFANKDILARSPDRKQSLIEEGEDVLSSVQNNVRSSNPCKAELRSRVRESLSAVRAAAARPETALPCDQRFSNTGNQVSNFRDTVLDLQPPVSPDQVQEVANQGEQVINMIENNVPANDPCRSEMTSQVRGLIQRVESLTARVRVETGEADDRREELIQELLGSVSALEGTREGAESVTEEVIQTPDT